MNQLNKNRLIGGSVLVFAALLFTPAILTPKPSGLENPTLAVRINSDNESKPLQVSVLPKIPEPNQEAEEQIPSVQQSAPKPSIQLESVIAQEDNKTTPPPTAKTEVAITPPSLKPQTPPSRPKVTKVTPSKVTPSRPKQGVTLKSTGKKTSWLRVGSFSSKKNASKLLKQLRKKYGYPVKVEVSTVDGKTYHRVLVGPYNKEDKLQSARSALIKDGHNPSIQR